MGARLGQHPFFPMLTRDHPRRSNRLSTSSMMTPQGTCPGSGILHSLFQTPNLTLSPLWSSSQAQTKGPGIISLPSLLEVGRAGRAGTWNPS